MNPPVFRTTPPKGPSPLLLKDKNIACNLSQAFKGQQRLFHLSADAILAEAAVLIVAVAAEVCRHVVEDTLSSDRSVQRHSVGRYDFFR